MNIETKFNIGDSVRTVRLGDRGLGTGTIIYIGIDIHLTTIYTISFTNDKLVSCRECELVGVSKPDIVYYATAKSINFSTIFPLDFPVTCATLNKRPVDNVKITYDATGVFKDIEKI